MMRAIIKYGFMILTLFLLSLFSIQAQQRTEFNRDFKRAENLYRNDAYISSQSLLESLLLKYPNISGLKRAEVEALKVRCAIKLKKPNIDGLTSEFSEKYPYAPQLSTIKFELSLFYFEKGEYARSLNILTSLNSKTLPKEAISEYRFNMAYCYMRVGNNQAAVDGFKHLLEMSQNPYTSSAKYYLAYIYYIDEKFEEAVSLFDQLVKDDRFSLFSRYFLLESYFMLKDYKYVSENGVSLYEAMTGDYKIKIARILSEAYFALDMPREAKTYFEIFSSSGASLSRKDNYYSGIVSYALNSYLAAIDAFTKVASTEDSLGQSAFYYLGNSYLKIKNKHGALNAFKSASSTEYDLTIKEEAFFNYAKLSFDVSSDISPFNAYLKEFPSSVKSDEINDYIATSFLLKKNYKSAIIALNKIKKLKPSSAINLQKAAFFRSMQLFERGAYRSAITDFNISLKNGYYNQPLSLLSSFWLAEAYYRSNEFDKTVSILSTLISNEAFKKSDEYPLSLYNIAYAYFKLANFDNAILWFRNYLDLTPSRRALTLEAQTRLADCYFMKRDYERAAEMFDLVASKTYDFDDIYAAYQGAIAYGLISQEGKKVEILGKIVENRPSSTLYPKALYELGRTYVQLTDTDNAISCFNQLMEITSDSTYHSKALIELGMINSNLSNYEEALKYYSSIIDNYPLSEEAQSALVGIETIYQIQNKPEEYLAYLDRIGMSSIKTADEKESMLFNSAEQIFLSEAYPEALNALNSFLQSYPDGAKSAQAYFYLGETLQKMDKKEAAADAYYKVIEKGDGSFAELATLYYARISYQLEKFDKAIEAYETLSRIAKLENNKFSSIVGRMRSYYHNGNYENAISTAKELVETGIDTQKYEIETDYIIAKSNLAIGRRSEAAPYLKRLEQNSLTAEGAEAAYLLIVDVYDEGDFAAVEEKVYALSDSKTPHSYWLAKSFIVLGDSFAEREEWEQAVATFTSIKEGYTPETEHDDVLSQVEVRLNRISAQQAEIVSE